MKIKSIKRVPFEGNVYNIGVANNNNYFANKCLVHNCYVSAKKNGESYKNVSETWRKWMATYKEFVNKDNILITEKPFQIAIGSEGEPTMSPNLCDFLKTVYETNVTPNYTTNGIILSYWNKPDSVYYKQANEILEATSKYVGRLKTAC